jgi:hypothetical protein
MALAIAAVGVLGTLVAALFTQMLANRAEARRRDDENHTRWLSERRRVDAELLALSLKLERHLWSACSFLDSEVRSERLPGFTSVLLTTEGGVPPVLDKLAREILVKDIEEAFAALDELEVLVVEVELIGTAEEAATARDLWESLSDVVGLLEAFALFDQAADAVERSRSARDEFSAAARAALRIEDPAIWNQTGTRNRRPLSADREILLANSCDLQGDLIKSSIKPPLAIQLLRAQGAIRSARSVGNIANNRNIIWSKLISVASKSSTGDGRCATPFRRLKKRWSSVRVSTACRSRPARCSRIRPRSTPKLVARKAPGVRICVDTVPAC